MGPFLIPLWGKLLWPPQGVPGSFDQQLTAAVAGKLHFCNSRLGQSPKGLEEGAHDLLIALNVVERINIVRERHFSLGRWALALISFGILNSS